MALIGFVSNYPPPATPRELEQADAAVLDLQGQPLCPEWRQVLAFCNGRVNFNPDYSCMITGTAGFDREHQEYTMYSFIEDDPVFLKPYLFIGETYGGDVYCLNTNLSATAPQVVLFSHGIGTIEQPWPTVVEFLRDVLAEDTRTEAEKEDP